MITLERAAELVNMLRILKERNAAIDLFCHFDDVFKLSSRDDNGKAITEFAAMCGFPIATNVVLAGNFPQQGRI